MKFKINSLTTSIFVKEYDGRIGKPPGRVRKWGAKLVMLGKVIKGFS